MLAEWQPGGSGREGRVAAESERDMAQEPGSTTVAALPRDLRITDVQSLTFTYRSRVGRDDEGHAHPAPAHEATQRLTRIQTSAGVAGHCFGGSDETAVIAR